MEEPGAHELTELLLAWGDGDEERWPGSRRSCTPNYIASPNVT